MVVNRNERTIYRQRIPLILILFSLYLFESFKIESNGLILVPRNTSRFSIGFHGQTNPIQKILHQFWLRFLRITSGHSFFLKSFDDGKIYRLYCASDSKFFRELWQTVKAEGIEHYG